MASRPFLCALALLLALCVALPVPAPAVEIAGVASVVDADTLDIHGQRIRLYGIDAPESAQQCQRDGTSWACGREASFAVADLIGRKTVRCEQRDIDRYGRVVAVRRVGDIDLGAWLVRRGYALAYRRYSKDYVDEENTARKSRAGIWAGEFVKPWDWRRGKRLSGGSSDDAASPRHATHRQVLWSAVPQR